MTKKELLAEMKQASPQELFEAAMLDYKQKDEDGEEYGRLQAMCSWRCLAKMFFELGQKNGWEYVSLNAWVRHKKQGAQKCDYQKRQDCGNVMDAESCLKDRNW